MWVSYKRCHCRGGEEEFVVPAVWLPTRVIFAEPRLKSGGGGGSNKKRSPRRADWGQHIHCVCVLRISSSSSLLLPASLRTHAPNGSTMCASFAPDALVPFLLEIFFLPPAPLFPETLLLPILSSFSPGDRIFSFCPARLCVIMLPPLPTFFISFTHVSDKTNKKSKDLFTRVTSAF